MGPSWAAAVVADTQLPSAGAGETVNVTWTSDNPHLTGNFLPVLREIDVCDLRVTSGRIPAELRGIYMRNGPNPQFEPIGFTYPLDGDGMIHAVYLEGGKARYRNRFVKTGSLEVERRVGHAVFGSFAHPVQVDPTVFLPGEIPSPLKNGAFINIIRHGGRILALNEATACYELDTQLETIGQWKAGTSQPLHVGAHNRRHPRTGDLYALEYTWRNPTLKFHRLNPSGLLVKTVSVDLPMPTMVHDFVLTENYIVLIAGPAVFDAEAAKAGKPFLQWRPDIGMRVALLPIVGGAPVWIETDPSFAYHFGNGFERGHQIVVDYAHHEEFSFKGGGATFKRMVIDPARRTVKIQGFSDDVVEFPRVNQMYEALPTRYNYFPTLSASLKMPDPPSAVFNTVIKLDSESGKSTRHDFGNHIVGEAVFVPTPGGPREDDGYVAAFTYDPVHSDSSLVLLDARHIDDEPVAVIAMPQRVPQGLHGNWMPT